MIVWHGVCNIVYSKFKTFKNLTMYRLIVNNNMTTDQLSSKFCSTPMTCGYGTWKYSVYYKGDIITRTTHNEDAILRIRKGTRDMFGSTELRDKEKGDYGYTAKQALQALYDEAVKPEINAYHSWKWKP